MFRGKFPRQLGIYFFILLFGPVLVCSFLGLVFTNGNPIWEGLSNVDPIWIIGTMGLLILSTFIYVRRQQHRGHRVDHYQLQGAEREPVLPEPRHDFDHELNNNANDEGQF